MGLSAAGYVFREPLVKQAGWCALLRLHLKAVNPRKIIVENYVDRMNGHAAYFGYTLPRAVPRIHPLLYAHSSIGRGFPVSPAVALAPGLLHGVRGHPRGCPSAATESALCYQIVIIYV